MLTVGKDKIAQFQFVPTLAPRMVLARCQEFVFAVRDSLETTALKSFVITALMVTAQASAHANALLGGRDHNATCQFAWTTALAEVNAFDLDSVIALRDGLAKAVLSQPNKILWNVFISAASTVNASKVCVNVKKDGLEVIAAFESAQRIAVTMDSVKSMVFADALEDGKARFVMNHIAHPTVITRANA